MRSAIYVRVSTLDQSVENQLDDLKKYVAHRGWQEPVAYSDRGVSGAKDRRPALDSLLKAARRRQIDVVVVWRLDRLGRSLKHLLDVLQELQALGVTFISLNEGIDGSTPAGRLQMHMLGAFAEFERARIVERVRAGLARARRQGKQLGRPRKAPPAILVPGGSVREAARAWGVSKSTAARWITAGRLIPSTAPAGSD
jgi:DNA invertase Pin-like site-specific DNA recombinase